VCVCVCVWRIVCIVMFHGYSNGASLCNPTGNPTGKQAASKQVSQPVKTTPRAVLCNLRQLHSAVAEEWSFQLFMVEIDLWICVQQHKQQAAKQASWHKGKVIK